MNDDFMFIAGYLVVAVISACGHFWGCGFVIVVYSTDRECYHSGHWYGGDGSLTAVISGTIRCFCTFVAWFAVPLTLLGSMAPYFSSRSCLSIAWSGLFFE